MATDVLAYGFADTLPAAVARKRAYEAAGRALALNQLSLGYSVLALLQMLDGQHEEAVASARKAVALGPNSAEAYLNLAVVLIYAGLHEDALQAIETVLRLNPKPSRQVREYHAFVLYMVSAMPTRSRPRQGTGRGHGQPRPGNVRRGQRTPGATGRGERCHQGMLQRQPEMCIAWFRVTFAHHAREQDGTTGSRRCDWPGCPNGPMASRVIPRTS